MANEQNLKPFDSNQSREEAKKNGQKGGIKSGESKRLKKTMAEIGQSLAEAKPSKKLVEKTREIFPHLTEEEVNNKLLLMAKLYEQAMKGNLKAIEMFRDTIGEQPINKHEAVGDLPFMQIVVDGVDPNAKPSKT